MNFFGNEKLKFILPKVFLFGIFLGSISTIIYYFFVK